MPVYIVKRGDTMTSIAYKLRVSLDYLIEMNSDNIPDPDVIYPGDKVYY